MRIKRLNVNIWDFHSSPSGSSYNYSYKFGSYKSWSNFVPREHQTSYSKQYTYVYNLFHVFDHEEHEYVLGIGAFIQLYDAPNKKTFEIASKAFFKNSKDET